MLLILRLMFGFESDQAKQILENFLIAGPVNIDIDIPTIILIVNFY